MAKKQATNSFNAAAISLCLTPEQLQERLNAHTDLLTARAERDRAIDAAYHENQRLRDLAGEIIRILEPINSPTGKLSKSSIRILVQYAKNITFPQDAKPIAELQDN